MRLSLLKENSSIWGNAEPVEEIFLQFEHPQFGTVVWTPTQTVIWNGQRWFRGPITKYTPNPDGSITVDRSLGGKALSQEAAEAVCTQIENPVKPGQVYLYK